MAEDAREGPLRLGDRFLKYVIRGLVGRGGHAWVYAGRDEFMERDVAIKILHRIGGVTSDMVRRGRAEAQLLHRLRHPNVVEVLDAGITDPGQLYIVMELLRGRTLREILRSRGRLSATEALPLFIEMAKGVEAAHAIGAIHRDLKPENVFVLYDNTPKILDFGIAKVIDSAFTTEKNVIHGTMLYIAPEQLEGFRATPRSDIYTFGLMLFEALLGRHPCLLGGGSPTVRELALIQSAKTPPSLDELDPTIPRHLARLVARAITKRPEQRFASVSEVRAAMQESLARRVAEGRTGHVEARADALAPHANAVPDTERLPGRPSVAATATRSRDVSRAPSTSGKAISPNTVPPVAHGPKARDVHESSRRNKRHRSFGRVLAAGVVVGTVAGGAAASFLTLRAAPDRSDGTIPAVATRTTSAEPMSKSEPVQMGATSPSEATVPTDMAPAASSPAATRVRAAVNASGSEEVSRSKPKPLVTAAPKPPAKSALSEPLAPPERKAWAE